MLTKPNLTVVFQILNSELTDTSPLIGETEIITEGGGIVFIREGLITKRLENLETKISETICLELTVSNKKWFILFAYRPPQENNKYTFFNELNETLSKAVNS